MIGEREGTFLEKGSLPLPKPHPLPPKTFAFIESLMQGWAYYRMAFVGRAVSAFFFFLLSLSLSLSLFALRIIVGPHVRGEKLLRLAYN